VLGTVIVVVVVVVVVVVLTWFGVLLNSLFLRTNHVKCDSAKKSKRTFRLKFPGITVPSKVGIHELILESQVYWITSEQNI
jgi:hypothetical protein